MGFQTSDSLQKTTCAFYRSFELIFFLLSVYSFVSYGRVAEWPIAAVLKTAVGQPTVGSNPTSSVFSKFDIKVLFLQPHRSYVMVYQKNFR